MIKRGTKLRYSVYDKTAGSFRDVTGQVKSVRIFTGRLRGKVECRRSAFVEWSNGKKGWYTVSSLNDKIDTGQIELPMR